MKEKEGFWEWSPYSRQSKQYGPGGVEVQRMFGEKHVFLCGQGVEGDKTGGRMKVGYRVSLHAMMSNCMFKCKEVSFSVPSFPPISH